jgi:hypothetical protein
MRKIAPVLLMILAVAFAYAGEARADFIGDYVVGNWTTSLTGTPPGGGGSVLTGGAPGSIVLQGGNGTTQSGPFCTAPPCLVMFTINAAAAGTISFDFAYLSSDSSADHASGPAFDTFGRVFNGSRIQLSNDAGSASQSGDNVSFPVALNDLIGFYVDCTDCLFGAAAVTISDFNFTAADPDLAATPEPATLLLFGTSAVGMVAAWRRRQRK